MRHRILQFLLASVIALPATTDVAGRRHITTLNDGWLFQAPNSENTEAVSIPHSWNSDAYRVKDYLRGTGVYEKRLTTDFSDSTRRYIIRFEGVSKDLRLSVNGTTVGSHKGGYTPSTFDITPYLNRNNDNVIRVEVDNIAESTPPVSGDFTFFGGIYRDVHLLDIPSVHFSVSEGEGLKIVTDNVSADKADISLQTTILNDLPDTSEHLTLTARLYDPDGKLLDTVSRKVNVRPGKALVEKISFGTVHNPRLWSPENPELYKTEILLSDRNGKETDRLTSYTGFRWFSLDADKGFILNGQPYKLRGVCRHQDQKPIGPAISDEMHRRDMQMIKDMGANFIRISHYPQDEAVLEMCDRLGLLAWEEIPVIDFVPDNEEYAATAEQNLREMIHRDFNHPAVVMWGYMNEILLKTDRNYKKGTPEYEAALERTRQLAQRLEKVLHEEDPYRLSTMAYHGSDSYHDAGLSAITDLSGWNLYQGWYGGDMTEFERFLSRQHREHPERPLLVSEYGAGSDRRIHSLTPEPFDFSMEYQQNYLEHYIPVIEDSTFVAGGTYWNFIDFSSALREESMPRINNKGIVDAYRNPKDVYYYLQARWIKDEPVIHIAVRDWPQRVAVSDSAMTVIPVKVYTNAENISLNINGKQINSVPVNNCIAVFNVPFSHGNNILEAVDNKGNHDVATVNMEFIPGSLTNDFPEFGVNVGSHCWFRSDESGFTWLPDRPYSEGGWGYIGGTEHSTTGEIAGTADNPLYQTLRRNISSYRFDLPDGEYEVELGFADPFGKKETLAYALGADRPTGNGNENRFDISANGEIIESDFSPASAAGTYFAVKKRYILRSENGVLQLDFIPEKGDVFLNTIKIRRL